MAVRPDDVRRIAALARLGIPEARVGPLVAELNGILAHMDVLQKVDTSDVQGIAGVGAAGMPLREDAGSPIPLARSREDMAPVVRDGFFLVPRLHTHGALGGAGEEEVTP